jgi:molecular chaperone GrpE (heat shock protein)
MSNVAVPKISKWPFFLADILLLAVAWFIYLQSRLPMGPWELAAAVASVALAAWCGFLPYVMEYRAAVRLMESQSLQETVEQIGKLEDIGKAIGLATSQWQTVQEHSARSVNAASEIAARITAEAKAFAEFMQKANDAEKGHLRLEVEKLRRAEGEWLQTVTRILDHVHALHGAGVRSGQPQLISQLGMFQDACRDAVRRHGLVAFAPNPGEAFDPARHQLPEGAASAEPGVPVGGTLAAGFTYQGQLLRRAVVVLASHVAPASAAVAAEAQPGAIATVASAIATSDLEETASRVAAPSSPAEPPPELSAEEIEREIAEAEAAAERASSPEPAEPDPQQPLL